MSFDKGRLAEQTADRPHSEAIKLGKFGVPIKTVDCGPLSDFDPAWDLKFFKLRAKRRIVGDLANVADSWVAGPVDYREDAWETKFGLDHRSERAVPDSSATCCSTKSVDRSMSANRLLPRRQTGGANPQPQPPAPNVTINGIFQRP